METPETPGTETPPETEPTPPDTGGEPGEGEASRVGAPPRAARQEQRGGGHPVGPRRHPSRS